MVDLQYWVQTPAGHDLIAMGLSQGRVLKAKHTILELIETHCLELATLLAIDDIESVGQAENVVNRRLTARTAEEGRANLEARQ